MSKALAICAALIMSIAGLATVISVIDTDGAENDITISAPPTGAIPIITAADLARIGSGQTISGVTWSLEAYYYLTGNITLTGVNNHTPIGTESRPFTGTLDGRGYAISGLNISMTVNNASGMYFVGLFGHLGPGGTITNLGIVNSTLSLTINSTVASTTGYVGGLVGYADQATISNSYNDSAVSSSQLATSGAVTMRIGGIVGHATNSSSINSFNTGSILGDNRTPLGTISSTLHVGGIAGSIRTSVTIADSHNTGAVSSINGTAAGIVATATESGTVNDMRHSLIINTYNTGAVTTTNNRASTAYASGIVHSGHVHIINCFNAGTVTVNNSGGSSVVSGIINLPRGVSELASTAIINCYNRGTVQQFGGSAGSMVSDIASDVVIGHISFKGAYGMSLPIHTIRGSGTLTIESVGIVNPATQAITAANGTTLYANALLPALAQGIAINNLNQALPWKIVSGTNGGMPILDPLTITSSPANLSLISGSVWTYTPTLNVSGSTLSVSGVPWLTLSGGTISGTVPAPTAGTSQNFEVTLIATRGFSAATQTFTISAFSSAFPANTDSVYVHYLDGFTYTTGAPAGSVISAQWTNPNISQDLTINQTNRTISIATMELVSGTYELSITASQAGRPSSVMSLFIHVYPHEIRNLDPFGLSFWSYTVSTNNPADTMSIIRVTNTVGGVTNTVTGATIDPITRTVNFNFTQPGLYEFALKLTGPTGNNNTLVLRLWVTTDVISGTPSINGITVISNGSGNFDFVLQTPINFAIIIWDFGDGTTEQNQNTTRNYTYLIGGIFTVSATLVNSFGAEASASATVDNLIPSMPETAYRNQEYVAIVPVAATASYQITVEGPTWITWEFIPGGSINYVRIVGTFSDINLVGNVITMTVSTNGATDQSWTVLLRPANTDYLSPAFLLERVGYTEVRIMYSGSWDAATILTVQWTAGGSHSILPRNVWVYQEYESNGTMTITVTATRLGIQVTTSQTVSITGVLVPAFVLEKVSDTEVRIMYTGTQNWESLTVQWTQSGDHITYAPSPTGWMYHEYTENGEHILTLTVSRGTTIAQVSQTIEISGVTSGQETYESGNFSSVFFAFALALVIVAIIAAGGGRYDITIFSVLCGSISAFLGVIL
ncbi:MAG: hypothetical protein FWD92_00010 [Methanomassiliicoccaceae archaeon]|nr:hypothetical protein [Methanomassiliicoccaceae archaeon]